MSELWNRRKDTRSEEAKKYRHLYNNTRWCGPSGRRLTQLRSEPLCRMCKEAGRLTPATIADHIVDHKGDPVLFWEGELQSLCKPHHDGAKQFEDINGFDKGVDNDGWPIDPRHPANR